TWQAATSRPSKVVDNENRSSWTRLLKCLRPIRFSSESRSNHEQDYRYPFTSDPRTLVNNHVLSVMAHHASISDRCNETELKIQTRLLEHPVCRKLAYLKWKQFGWWIFLIDFLCYSLFVGLFTWATLRNIEPAKFYDAVNVSYADIYSTADSHICQSVSEK